MKLLTITALMFLSGCAALVGAPPTKANWTEPAAVAPTVRVERDDFKKLTLYIGSKLSMGNNEFGEPNLDLLLIRAWKPDIGSMSYQIYVADYYRGPWRFYSSAYDSNGNLLDTSLISRDVLSCRGDTCTHAESVGLNVSREYLEKAQSTGISFKLSGKGGEAVFSIPPGYVQAFLSVAK